MNNKGADQNGWSAPLLFTYGKKGFLMKWLTLFEWTVKPLATLVLMRNLIWAFTDCQCDKYPFHTCCMTFFNKNISWGTIKPKNSHMHTVNTPISQGIPVWSVSSTFTMSLSLGTHSKSSEDISLTFNRFTEITDFHRFTKFGNTSLLR